MSGRHLIVPPLDPAAEQVCLLTREWAARREAPVDAFLINASLEVTLTNGIEYHLPSAHTTWEQVQTFIREEGECCPFLAFEAAELSGETILRLTLPDSTEASLR